MGWQNSSGGLHYPILDILHISQMSVIKILRNLILLMSVTVARFLVTDFFDLLRSIPHHLYNAISNFPQIISVFFTFQLDPSSARHHVPPQLSHSTPLSMSRLVFVTEASELSGGSWGSINWIFEIKPPLTESPSFHLAVSRHYPRLCLPGAGRNGESSQKMIKHFAPCRIITFWWKQNTRRRREAFLSNKQNLFVFLPDT